MNYITIAVPFFILFIALEFIYGWLSKRNTYRINDTVGSLQMGVLSQSKGFLRLGVSGLVFANIPVVFPSFKILEYYRFHKNLETC